MSPPAEHPAPGERTRAVEALLELERHRTMAASAFEPDPARLAAGWEPRFVADGARAREAIELYERLGFEVCADPVRAAAGADACRDCQLVALLQFRMIYTRHPPAR